MFPTFAFDIKVDLEVDVELHIGIFHFEIKIIFIVDTGYGVDVLVQIPA